MNDHSFERRFDDIYNSTYSVILHYIISRCGNIDDINDIVQEVYYQFSKYIKKNDFTDMHSAMAFLLNLSRKQLAKYYRKKKIHNEALADIDKILEHDAEIYEKTEESVIDKILLDNIWKEIENGGEQVMNIFKLKYLHEMSFKKIACEIGIPESTVKTIYYRALRKLKKKFNNKKHERG